MMRLLRRAFVLVVGPAVLIATMAITLAPASARATLIFNNFDPGGGFDPQQNVVAAEEIHPPFLPVETIRAAAEFTVGGGNYNLSAVTLPIGFQGSLLFGQRLSVLLAADSGGAPGATVEVLSASQLIWPTIANPFTTTTTLDSVIHPLLSNGSSYWVVTELTSLTGLNANYNWFFNTSGTTALYREQQKNGGLVSDPWTGFSGQENVAFSVEGTPVPEPTTALLLAGGLLGLAGRGRRKKAMIE